MSLRTDDIGFGGFKIIQNPQHFCYGVDAVLLADFASRHLQEHAHVLDMGTGNGIIPMIMAAKCPSAQITGIDLLQSNIEMAEQSAVLNGLCDRLTFLTMDVNEASAQLGKGQFQVVTCNPPYFPKDAGLVGHVHAKTVARQETTADIHIFIGEASRLLEAKGHLYMIHRPARLVDVLCTFRNHGVEPKELRFVTPREGDPPNLVLIHGIKGAGKELKILPMLAVHDEGNGYTDEILRIYEKDKGKDSCENSSE